MSVWFRAAIVLVFVLVWSFLAGLLHFRATLSYLPIIFALITMLLPTGLWMHRRR